MSINKAQLGQAIRQVRELRGYSQAALGRKSGLQGNTVALIERGKRGVSLDALNELAKVLDIPAACLTMLGTSGLKGDAESAELIKNMQELILATFVAQSRLQAREEAERASQARVEAVRAGSRLKAVARST